jgi:uncharacterized membrane protein YcaP (DUF421 family)
VWAVFRAAFGYCFLVFIVRIAGRRPGKHLSPFEFVLIFYMGGITLTYIVGDNRSLTNAFCQVITITLTHISASSNVRSCENRLGPSFWRRTPHSLSYLKPLPL